MTEKKGKIFSGMRPTGRLHLGHLSVLENWAALQEDYECVYGVVDWHALTTSYEDTLLVRQNTIGLLLDYLSVGIDPEKSIIMQQSKVKEHAELFLLFSMMMPLSWLERVPTYKDQIAQFAKSGKDITTYGFLGYPVLMAADILVYLADTVPVGEDQLPHLEFTRELSRRFNHMYGSELFPEPKHLLSEIPLLTGVDGRKMSKSYNNYIPIVSDEKEISEKVRAMVTDPARIRKDDPGNPDICVVYTYQKIYNPDEAESIEENCRKGRIGCVECKKNLARKLTERLSPIWDRRHELEKDMGYVTDILAEGNRKARQEAAATLEKVNGLMGLY